MLNCKLDLGHDIRFPGPRVLKYVTNTLERNHIDQYIGGKTKDRCQQKKFLT